MKRILFIAMLFLITADIQAQGYTQAVGIRAGWISPGIEYRYYLSDDHSLKGLLSIRERGVQLHALTEIHQYDLFSFTDQLVFFYGAGIHFGFESWDEPVIRPENLAGKVKSSMLSGSNNETILPPANAVISGSEVHSSLLAGLDGLIGLEYLFYEAPLKVGVELKPFFDVFGQDGFKIELMDMAFTVKYLF